MLRRPVIRTLVPSWSRNSFNRRRGSSSRGYTFAFRSRVLTNKGYVTYVRAVCHSQVVPPRRASCSPEKKDPVLALASQFSPPEHFGLGTAILRVSPIHQCPPKRRPRYRRPNFPRGPHHGRGAARRGGPPTNGKLSAGIMVPLCSHYGAIYDYVRAGFSPARLTALANNLRRAFLALDGC